MNQVQYAKKIDVHHYERQKEVQKDLFEKENILDENKDLIRKFINYCEIDPKVNGARTIKYLYTLRYIARLVNKGFKEMDREDINELLAKIQNLKTLKGNSYSPSSLREFRKAISKFWRWMYFDEYRGQAPHQIAGMSLGDKDNDKEPEIYTKEEIESIINGMTTLRNKAFFSCLYDLQCRVSELLDRQIKHIIYEDNSVEILIEPAKVKKKVKPHREPLFESISNFNTWMRLHPDPTNPDAPLWPTMKKGGIITPMSYALAQKLLKNSCKRHSIRIGNRNHLHMFRKSKATHDYVRGVPIEYIELRGSWTKGSEALRQCYLALNKEHKDNAYRQIYGLIKQEAKDDATKLKSCNRCHISMKINDIFCSRCGHAIDSKAYTERKQNEETISKDKDLLSDIVKKIIEDKIAKGELSI